MEKTKKEKLEEANQELSQACFESGRMHYEIKLQENKLEDMRLKFHNMGVNFQKIHDRYKKALDEYQQEQRSAQSNGATEEFKSELKFVEEQAEVVVQ